MPVAVIARSVESVFLKSQSCGSTPFIPVGKIERNLVLHERDMKSTRFQTTRRAFLRSTAAAAAGLAVLPGAPAEAAASRAARNPGIKLGLDNFSVRALGWKAAQLIKY